MGYLFFLNLANCYAWLFGAWSFREISKDEDQIKRRISNGFCAVCSGMFLINFLHTISPWL